MGSYPTDPRAFFAGPLLFVMFFLAGVDQSAKYLKSYHEKMQDPVYRQEVLDKQKQESQKLEKILHSCYYDSNERPYVFGIR